jgi:exosortase A
MNVTESTLASSPRRAPFEACPGASSDFRVVVFTLGAVLSWNVALYWHTAGAIAAIWWRSDTFAHGLVVLPIFAWLVWHKRAAIGGLRPRPVAWLALPAAGAGFMWLLGELVPVPAAAHTGFVSMLVIGMVAALGWRLARVLMFPLAFLFFGLPVGEFLLPALMAMTADFTVFSLRLVGVPVYQEGLQFVIPTGRWSVVEACSGIRYLIASMMLGALYAWFNYVSQVKRFVFMLVAIVVPVVANWLRAWMIVMLGYLSDNRLAAGVDHLIYGWVFFGIVIAVMFVIGQRWADPAAGPESHAVPEAVPERATRWLGLAPLALVGLGFAVGHAWLAREVAPFTVRYALFTPAPGWTAEDPGRVVYRANYGGSRGEAVAAYGDREGGMVLVQTAFYVSQREGSNMVVWGNGFVAGDDPDRSALLPLPEAVTALGRATNVWLKAGNGGGFRIWRWYVTGGGIVTRDWELKLRLAYERLAGRGDAAMVVVLAAPVSEIDEDGGAAETRLARFVADHAAGLERIFVDATAARGAP